ncbi:UNVERIFIED_CONTAM: hypothetical protein GTU68_012227, partial [Idotea baltica]|nr:hypothetical protein [Idotea baltica]
MADFQIAPSILSADFARLGEEVDNVLASGADIVHFDVMDNHYVPNLTIGPLVCEALRKHGVTAEIDVHLMVKPVDRIIPDFAKAGASFITFHPEASDHIDRSLQLVKNEGCKTGLVFNPATPLSLAEHVMDKVDRILLMSVNPGFGGQSFIPHTLDKLRQARKMIDDSGYDIDLEIDGGVNVKNIRAIAEAGARTFSYLFESVHGGEKWGRYSIIGLPCDTVIKVSGQEIITEQHGDIIEQASSDDPLSWIENYKDQYKVPDLANLPRFNGGLVGYFGYDTVRYIEPRLGDCPNPDPLACPDILLMVSNNLIVFDNLSGRLFLIVHADPNTDNAYAKAQEELDALTEQLRTTTPNYSSQHTSKTVNEDDFVSGFTHDGFIDAVEKAKQYITDGDIMQVVLSQRLSVPFSAQAIDLYRSLRTLNPSPYMYYLNLGDFHIVGSSPEILVRMEENEVTVRPIAGTRPRGRTVEEDKAFEQDLLSDPKELAEHLMLIDLGRNDAGRVSQVGTVKLTAKMIIER